MQPDSNKTTLSNTAENAGKRGAKTRTLKIGTVLPADRDRIFHRLCEVATLQYIAAPYASFEPCAGAAGPALNTRWQAGKTMSFRLRLFGFIPCGIHTIRVLDFDRRTGHIYTNESNRFVPVWNHRIRLRPQDDAETHYEDEVEIGAGWKTIFVYAWAVCFYRHRQKKWKKLLGQGRRGEGG